MNIDVSGNYEDTTVVSAKTYLTDDETETEITNGYQMYVNIKMKTSSYEFDIKASMIVILDSTGNPDEMFINFVSESNVKTKGTAYYHEGFLYTSIDIDGRSYKYKAEYSNVESAMVTTGLNPSILISVDDCIYYLSGDGIEDKFTVQISEEGTTKKFKVDSTAEYGYGNMSFYLIFENDVFSGLTFDVDVTSSGTDTKMELTMMPYDGTIKAPDITQYEDIAPSDF